MNEHKNLPARLATQSLAATTEKHGSLVGRGLAAVQNRKQSGLPRNNDVGTADEQYRIGLKYYSGDGVSQNYEEAVKWYRLAAEQGYANAQFNLGNMYSNGMGVPANSEEAMKWYRLAADQGNPNAKRHLGYLYCRGFGVPQDYEKAGKWFLLAIEQGDGRSEYALSQLYKNGQGILPDYEEVVKRVAERDAAVSGYSKIMIRLMMKKELAAMGDADAQKYMQKFNIDWNE
jgi:TPR repeat protein